MHRDIANPTSDIRRAAPEPLCGHPLVVIGSDIKGRIEISIRALNDCHTPHYLCLHSLLFRSSFIMQNFRFNSRCAKLIGIIRRFLIRQIPSFQPPRLGSCMQKTLISPPLDSSSFSLETELYLENVLFVYMAVRIARCIGCM